LTLRLTHSTAATLGKCYWVAAAPASAMALPLLLLLLAAMVCPVVW
jgi:hypothetical protein